MKIDQKYGHFATERLLVRPWESALSMPSTRQGLIDELEAVLTPEVTAFLPGSMQIKPGESDIPGWIDAASEGSAVSCVRGFDTGALLGLLILNYTHSPDGTTVLRLGYLFGTAHWGNGYATELVRGLVENCKTLAMTGEILGGVEPENRASASVLRKAGFAYAEDASPGSSDMYRLRLI